MGLQWYMDGILMDISMVINEKEGKLVKVCQSTKITKLLKNYYLVRSAYYEWF